MKGVDAQTSFWTKMSIAGPRVTAAAVEGLHGHGTAEGRRRAGRKRKGVGPRLQGPVVERVRTMLNRQISRGSFIMNLAPAKKAT